MLFEHSDTDDNDSLTLQEFSSVCQEFNKRNMCVATPSLMRAAHNDTLCMFIDRLDLDFSSADATSGASHEDKLKAAFHSIYSKVDGDGNGKINFTEFAIWIIRSITGLDEFFKSFVCSKARSEKPPLYVKT